MEFDYFYEEQSESYSFYRTPKVFFTDQCYSTLSALAKILYGLLLDRVSLSHRNKWIDENGRIYVYMTISSIEQSLGKCHQKAIKLLDELEDFGLIERTKQGQGKPSRIYVKNFVAVCGSYPKKYVNHTSGSMQDIPLEVCKSYSNNTDINKTDINKTNPILSGGDVDKDERSAYREYLFDQLDMAYLRESYPFDLETLDAILNMMLDVICSKRNSIVIAGDTRPVSVVKSQFLKLDSSHIEYVMDCMKHNSTKIRNIKQYLLAALYNAPLTIKSFYQSMVNNDLGCH